MRDLKDILSVRGKTVLIAGGHGLYGDALAEAFSSAGARTYIAARDRKSLEELEQIHPNIFPLTLDLASEESIDAMAGVLFSEEERVDVLVNNAVARPMRSYSGPADAFRRSMDINATGLFNLTRLIGDHMAVQKKGSIINIGSIQGMVAPDASLYAGLDMDGFIPDYFFHKGGLVQLTRFWASYYGPSGVRCNCISPGGVFTEKLSEEFVRRYSERTMLGRMANPDDIVGLALFLASDSARYITGTNIPVDGGYTAK